MCIICCIFLEERRKNIETGYAYRNKENINNIVIDLESKKSNSTLDLVVDRNRNSEYF